MGQNWALCERLEAGPHPAGHHIATDQGHDVDAVGGAGGHVGGPYAELAVWWHSLVAMAEVVDHQSWNQVFGHLLGGCTRLSCLQGSILEGAGIGPLELSFRYAVCPRKAQN